MSDLVNLNKFRKRAAKAEATKQANRNRIRHGRTKAQRDVEQQDADRAKALLDQHRLPPKPSP